MSLMSRWEARIVVPTGGWDMDLTESGGGGTNTITLPAGNYYWNSTDTDPTLLLTLGNICDDQSIANGNSYTYTFSVSDGEAGTGKLTVSAAFGGTFTLTNVQSDLLALLGFDADLSPTASSFTSDNHVQGLWLPDCPVETPYGLASSGMPVSAAVMTMSEDGTYFASHGAKITRNEYTYAAVSLARTIAASESVASESYEQFWLDCIRGEKTWANAGRRLRYYKDVTDDATYKTYNVAAVQSPAMSRASGDYEGFWTVGLSVVEN